MDSNCPNELKSLSGNRVSLKMVETYSFLDKGFDLMRFVETCCNLTSTGENGI